MPLTPKQLTLATSAAAAGVAPGGRHADLPHAAPVFLRPRRRRGGGGGGSGGIGGGDGVGVGVEYGGRGFAVDAEVLLNQDLGGDRTRVSGSKGFILVYRDGPLE